ncbi:ImmA/IrrE family metallo-endopeptidase [Haloimpatiens massiliensis]|uniref:ImmA/IrrE family metallo-endopeptidase n=1 Tax=Haloimpatiens massiliensis TaxID=1658110 RepID=UPI000C825928|nr:ImmA/IrrE family metallo-endopeptidase [Haloimpatiens massiliensis]
MAKININKQLQLYRDYVLPIATTERNKIIPKDSIVKDTFGLLEQLGFFILKFPSFDDNLSGFYINKSGFKCVYVNSKHTLGRQFFSAWHEYYHVVTGEGGGVSLFDQMKEDIVECKAELFAGYILMPENLVFNYIKKNQLNLKYLSHNQIIRMQNYFKVSYTAMIKRLTILFPEYNNLGVLYGLGNKNRHEELCKKTIKLGGDITLIKPTNNFYVSQQFKTDVLENLKMDRIDEGRAEVLLNLNKDNISELNK